MLPDDAIPLLGPILVAQQWHPDYERVVKYARRNRLLATGQVAELLAPYWAGESDADFAKLLQVYVPTCDSVWKEITTPFYQVARLRDGQVERKFTYDESLSEETRARFIAAVTQAVDHYYNNKPLQDYLAEQLAPTVAMTDPNAWLLTSFAAFDYRTTQARPYPVLLPSHAVVHFTRVAGEVTSMTARYVVSTDDDTQALWRYTSYLPEHAVDFWPLDSKGQPTIPGGVYDGVVYDGEYVKFHYKVYEHGAGQVPATPLGYVLDQGAVGHVFWSPLHSAINFLLLELKTGQELQIVMRNMAMPRQLQYVAPCDGIQEDGGCVNGMCSTPRDKNYHDLRCRKCGGTGKNMLTQSAKDIITIPLSADPTENKLKLTDMLAFVGPSSDIPELQLKYQDWLSNTLRRVLFNSDTLDKTQVTDTATNRRIQLEQKAIALTPFADWFSGAYVHTATTCAVYVDAGQGFGCLYEFPADLELQSVQDLYAQLTAARLAGARPDECARLNLAIMRKTLASDPGALRRYEVRSRFVPLLGFDDKTILQWAALGRITEADVLTYVNQDRIFADALTANARFYDLPQAEQAKAVKEQVAIIRAELAAAPAAGGSFGRLSLTTNTQEAVQAAA